MTVEIHAVISDETAERVREKATDLGVAVEDFLHLAVEIVNELPSPIIDLLRELTLSGEAEDTAAKRDLLRQFALAASRITFERERAKAIAALPDGALDRHREDDDFDEQPPSFGR